MCICDVALFISILIEFADKRRSWQHVQLDLLYTVDRPRVILHAELSSWCLERVSMSIPCDNIPRPFPPRDNFWSDNYISNSARSRGPLLQNDFLSSSGSFLTKERASNDGRLIGKRRANDSSPLRSVPT